MAVLCGATAANLYYIHPLESDIASTFHIAQNMVGVAATLMQCGYAFGLLLLVPIGDMAERRSLIFRMLLLAGGALLLAAWSPSYGLFLFAMFTVGFTTIVPQLIVPYATQLTRPEGQGRMTGYVMSGLLIGILLSRVFSGLLGSLLGWQTVYLLAALWMFLLAITVIFIFPKSRPVTVMSYGELMRSIPKLIKTQRSLREAAINGFFMFGAFSVFWTSLIFLLKTPVYNMGAREAGLFGLAGLAGAFAAPLIGKIADKRDPRAIIGVGIILSTTGFLLFHFCGLHIWGLIMGVIVLDLGNQCGQVSNIAKVQSLSNSMRSRNGTVFMFFYFVGGATGSFLGTLCWQNFGWVGVCSAGLAFLLTALVFHFLIYKNTGNLKRESEVLTLQQS